MCLALGSRSPIKIQGQNLDSQYSYQKKRKGPMYVVAKVLCPIRLPPTRQLFKEETDILNIIKDLLMELSFCLAPF